MPIIYIFYKYLENGEFYSKNVEETNREHNICNIYIVYFACVILKKLQKCKYGVFPMFNMFYISNLECVTLYDIRVISILFIMPRTLHTGWLQGHIKYRLLSLTIPLETQCNQFVSVNATSCFHAYKKNI